MIGCFGISWFKSLENTPKECIQVNCENFEILVWCICIRIKYNYITDRIWGLTYVDVKTQTDYLILTLLLALIMELERVILLNKIGLIVVWDVLSVPTPHNLWVIFLKRGDFSKNVVSLTCAKSSLHSKVSHELISNWRVRLKWL